MSSNRPVCLAVALLGAFTLLMPMQAPAADKPLDQKGHDQRVKREQQNRERVDRENKVQRQQDAIRDRAQKGGYEGDYDKAVGKYGGPRTQESVDKSRPKTGAGHPGDHVQPGLTGKEGGR